MHKINTIPLSPLRPKSIATPSNSFFSFSVRGELSRRVEQCLRTTSNAPFMYHSSHWEGDWTQCEKLLGENCHYCSQKLGGIIANLTKINNYYLSWVLGPAPNPNTHPLVGGVKGALLCPHKLITQAMQAQLQKNECQFKSSHKNKINYSTASLPLSLLSCSHHVADR